MYSALQKNSFFGHLHIKHNGVYRTYAIINRGYKCKIALWALKLPHKSDFKNDFWLEYLGGGHYSRAVNDGASAVVRTSPEKEYVMINELYYYFFLQNAVEK